MTSNESRLGFKFGHRIFIVMIINMFMKPLLLLILATRLEAFSTQIKFSVRRSSRPEHSHPLLTTTTEIASGRGWGNDDFLSSLGGDNDEREDEVEKYNNYKKSREEFDQRQRERMESPAGQQFMKQQQQMMAQQQQAREAMNRGDIESTGEFFQDLGMDNFPDEGDSRFGNMMRQASAGGMGRPGMGRSFGVTFEQKLAIPLDDDDREEEAIENKE